MEYLDHPFEVSTGSGRRPTPLAYEHLRDYPALVKQYLRLSSQTDIVNVNEILDLVGNLYVSNEISRVIAQIVGEKDPGFITIKATEDGALHVYLTNVAEAIEVNATLQAGDQVIGDVNIAGISLTPKSEDIHISGTGDKDIILADGTKSHYITSIMFTVSAETDVTLKDDGTVTSGPMNFGGTGEPMGLTHNFGLAPLVCGAGKKFQINLGVDVAVEGLVTYYSK
ncbi:hypothetical protein ES702_06762 [subsurface metagenome]